MRFRFLPLIHLPRLMGLAASTICACFSGILPASAQGQAQICNQIRQELSTLDRTGRQGGGGNPREAARVRTELSRAQIAYRQNECGQRGLFWSPPPVCGPIGAQVNQLSARLQQLEGAGRNAGGGDPARRAQLMAAYQRYNCDGPRETPRGPVYAEPPSLFERIFGGRPSTAVVDPEPERRREVDPELDRELRERAKLGGRMAVCVRTCDGFFFPVNYEGLSRGDSYEEVCEALCPSAETQVFFMRGGAEIETAATRSGQAYSSMPYAKQFQQSRDPACFCKPRDVTWAQVAKQTEDIIEARRGDVVVTPEQAAKMSLPKEAPGQNTRNQRRNPRQQADTNLPADTAAPTAVPESQIPTAGTASSGIGPRQNSRVVLGQSQGQLQEVIGPDGQKRQIRVVSPNRTVQ
jgi:Protein of unknown function (DUF2865)